MGDEEECGGKRDEGGGRVRVILREERGLQRQAGEPVGELGRDDVDRQVEDVVARDVQPPEAVVERHREVADKPAGVIGVVVPREEAVQVLDHPVIYDGPLVIQKEGDMEGIGVGDEGDHGDKEEMGSRSV